MFIEEYPDAVTPSLCARLITQFEADGRRAPSGVVLSTGEKKQKNFRSGTMVDTDYENPVWKALTDELGPSIHATMKSYVKKHPGLARIAESDGLICSQPMIERVDPGQGFDWHVDHNPGAWQRVVAGLLYLNTIEEAGETQFVDPERLVRPVAGKIVLFPPYWTHFHRGVSPTRETKYALSFFWLYRNHAAK